MPSIVVGYDGDEASTRALDRAIEEARSSQGALLVVAVAEMPFNPEGPQNFGTLDDSPARMIPLVEPPELAPVFAAARERIKPAGLRADYTWAAGEPGSAIVGAARESGCGADRARVSPPRPVLAHARNGRRLGGQALGRVRRHRRGLAEEARGQGGARLGAC